MQRNYESGKANNITFFTGIEIEKTPAFGLRTLFVVGVHDPYVILELARNNNCRHIYFGANQSFKTNGINDIETWRPWENMIYVCLDAEDELWCTLDFDVSETEGLLESGLTEKILMEMFAEAKIYSAN